MVPKQFQATNEDYFDSGWSREHMAPAGDHKYLASHQHFVKKEKKKRRSILEKKSIFFTEKEKKRHTVFARRKLKPTGRIILHIQ